MVGFVLCNTLSTNGPVSRAVCEIDKADNLQQLTERTEISKKKDKIVFLENDNERYLTGNEIVSMNMIGFTPAVFDIINSSLLDFIKPNRTSPTAEFYLPTILNDLVNKNETSIKVLRTTSSWFGITYKADKEWAREQITKLIEEKEYPAQLWPSS
jgi:NDP-sugar pyrophosphorylase family protein